MNLNTIVVAIAVIALGACGERDDADQSQALVHRRRNVPFGPQAPKPEAATLAQAREMDEIGKLMTDGSYDRARERLKRYFAAGGQHPSAYFYQGRLLSYQGDWAGAVEWFDRAIERSPHWLEPRLDLARCFFKTERLAAAEGVFDEIDRLLPKAAWGPYGKGVVALERGDTPRATVLLDQALGRDPKHAPSLWVRSLVARQANENALEQRLLERFIVADPGSAAAHFRLGELAFSSGRPFDARRSFERSYEFEPAAATARRLAELAGMRDDAADQRRWQERAGVLPDRGPAPPDPLPVR